MKTLTELETKVIQTYKKDDHVCDDGFDCPDSAAWIKDFAKDCGIPPSSFSGVISSLVQKELMWSDGEEWIGLTPAGIELAKTID